MNTFLAKTEIQTNESFNLKAQKKEIECYGCYQKVSRMHTAKIAPAGKIVRCVISSIQQYCMDWFSEKKTLNKKKSEKQNVEKTSENQNVSGNHKDLTYASVNMGSQVISMSVVPVKLVHENSNKMISTHALLNNCSQGTFVMKSIVDAMGIDGTPTSITIKTLNGDVTNASVAVEGLKVCRENIWVKIPKAFSRDELQVDAEDIATPEK